MDRTPAAFSDLERNSDNGDEDVSDGWNAWYGADRISTGSLDDLNSDAGGGFRLIFNKEENGDASSARSGGVVSRDASRTGSGGAPELSRMQTDFHFVNWKNRFSLITINDKKRDLFILSTGQ